MLERQQLNIVDPSAHTFWHWVRFDVVAEVARENQASQVVDIGAGSGMLGDWMATHLGDVTYRFEELSPTLDAALVEHFGADARHDSDQPIAGDTIVTMLDVVEHIDDDHAALAHLATRMDHSSTLVVTAPALQWAYSSWDAELGHHRRYSRRQLHDLLTGAGFEVESSEYLFPEMLVMLPVRKLRRGGRSDVDFPQLSERMNRVGYAVSSRSARWRRFWPAGTSVVATARRSRP